MRQSNRYIYESMELTATEDPSSLYIYIATINFDCEDLHCKFRLRNLI